MDDPNITMEEYIRLEEEKARRHISYKIIYVDNLKADSENDNDKVNMPSFPSLEPTVSYFNDLDYLKDFENEFPAIVYNDALTSKLDFLTEPSINPQHIDEFNLKDETSLSECDGEEQNVLYFNDLFPFNVIYPNGLKSDEDNDDKKSIQNSPQGIYLAQKTVRLEPPMSASMEARIAEHTAAHIPPTSPAYDQAPLGHRSAMIRMRGDIPKEDMPPRRRFILVAPPPGCDVVKSYAAAARAPRDRAEGRLYGQAKIVEDFYTQQQDAWTDRRDRHYSRDVRHVETHDESYGRWHAPESLRMKQPDNDAYP
ncbi:hypothetical protein Tco_0848287 [Tanacetum coccineum]